MAIQENDQRTLLAPKTYSATWRCFYRNGKTSYLKQPLTQSKKIRTHICKGCCSDIPPGLGTQKNEQLYKLLKKSLLGGASVILPELAIAVLSVVLYIWSSKHEPGAKKHSCNSKLIPVVPVELKQHHLLSKPNNTMPQHETSQKFKSSNMLFQVPTVMKKKSGNEATSEKGMKNNDTPEHLLPIH